MFGHSSALDQPAATYPTHHITTKLYLYVGGEDTVCDVEHLVDNLPAHAEFFTVHEYHHLDFLFAEDANARCWRHLIQMLS